MRFTAGIKPGLNCPGLALVLLSFIKPTLSFSRGASEASCTEMVPGHVHAHPHDPHLSHVTLHTSSTRYLPGHLVTVTVRSSRDFMGFLLQARTAEKPGLSTKSLRSGHKQGQMGRVLVGGLWTLTPPGTHTIRCVSDGDTVTHSDKQLKRNLSFVWRAPVVPMGDVTFYITVVQSYFVYWTGIRSPVLHDGTRSRWRGSITSTLQVQTFDQVSSQEQMEETASTINNSSTTMSPATNSRATSHKRDKTPSSFKKSTAISAFIFFSNITTAKVQSNYQNGTNEGGIGAFVRLETMVKDNKPTQTNTEHSASSAVASTNHKFHDSTLSLNEAKDNEASVSLLANATHPTLLLSTLLYNVDEEKKDAEDGKHFGTKQTMLNYQTIATTSRPLAKGDVHTTPPRGPKMLNTIGANQNKMENINSTQLQMGGFSTKSELGSQSIGKNEENLEEHTIPSPTYSEPISNIFNGTMHIFVEFMTSLLNLTDKAPNSSPNTTVHSESFTLLNSDATPTFAPTTQDFKTLFSIIDSNSEEAISGSSTTNMGSEVASVSQTQTTESLTLPSTASLQSQDLTTLKYKSTESWTEVYPATVSLPKRLVSEQQQFFKTSKSMLFTTKFDTIPTQGIQTILETVSDIESTTNMPFLNEATQFSVISSTKSSTNEDTTTTFSKDPIKPSLVHSTTISTSNLASKSTPTSISTIYTSATLAPTHSQSFQSSTILPPNSQNQFTDFHNKAPSSQSTPLSSFYASKFRDKATTAALKSVSIVPISPLLNISSPNSQHESTNSSELFPDVPTSQSTITSTIFASKSQHKSSTTLKSTRVQTSPLPSNSSMTNSSSDPIHTTFSITTPKSSPLFHSSTIFFPNTDSNPRTTSYTKPSATYFSGHKSIIASEIGTASPLSSPSSTISTEDIGAVFKSPSTTVSSTLTSKFAQKSTIFPVFYSRASSNGLPSIPLSPKIPPMSSKTSDIHDNTTIPSTIVPTSNYNTFNTIHSTHNRPPTSLKVPKNPSSFYSAVSASGFASKETTIAQAESHSSSNVATNVNNRASNAPKYTTILQSRSNSSTITASNLQHTSSTLIKETTIPPRSPSTANNNRPSITLKSTFQMANTASNFYHRSATAFEDTFYSRTSTSNNHSSFRSSIAPQSTTHVSSSSIKINSSTVDATNPHQISEIEGSTSEVPISQSEPTFSVYSTQHRSTVASMGTISHETLRNFSNMAATFNNKLPFFLGSTIAPTSPIPSTFSAHKPEHTSSLAPTEKLVDKGSSINYAATTFYQKPDLEDAVHANKSFQSLLYGAITKARSSFASKSPIIASSSPLTINSNTSTSSYQTPTEDAIISAKSVTHSPTSPIIGLLSTYTKQKPKDATVIQTNLSLLHIANKNSYSTSSNTPKNATIAPTSPLLVPISSKVPTDSDNRATDLTKNIIVDLLSTPSPLKNLSMTTTTAYQSTNSSKVTTFKQYSSHSYSFKNKTLTIASSPKLPSPSPISAPPNVAPSRPSLSGLPFFVAQTHLSTENHPSPTSRSLNLAITPSSPLNLRPSAARRSFLNEITSTLTPYKQTLAQNPLIHVALTDHDTKANPAISRISQNTDKNPGNKLKPSVETKAKLPPNPHPDREGKYPDIVPRHSAWELGMLLGCSAGLGMVMVVGVRYVYRKACGKRTEVTLHDREQQYSRGERGLIHVQECGDLVRVRRIRENSFVLLAEYDILATPGD